jgi:hypothetical protein
MIVYDGSQINCWSERLTDYLRTRLLLEVWSVPAKVGDGKTAGATANNITVAGESLRTDQIYILHIQGNTKLYTMNIKT